MSYLELAKSYLELAFELAKSHELRAN